MKRKFYWLASSVIAGISIIVACNKTEITRSGSTAATPSVTNVFPQQGADGGAIVIKGAHFAADAGANKVFFGDVPANVLNATDSTLTVIIPEKARSGEVTIETGNKTITALNNFVIDPHAAVVNGFSPLKMNSGDTVTVSGKGFTSSGKVFFGDREATEVMFVDEGTLRVIVPQKAGTGKLRVVNGEANAISSQDLGYLVKIHSVSSMSEEEGSEIIIYGEGFSANRWDNTVCFGTLDGVVAVDEFVYASPNQLTVKVPRLGLDGSISVFVGEGVDKVGNFIYLPSVKDFYPKTGGLLTPVTIKGRKLTEPTQVKVNGQVCEILSRTDTTCTFRMKSDMNVFDGMISYQMNGGDRLVGGGYFAVKGEWGQRNTPNSPGASLLGATNFAIGHKAYFIVNNKLAIYDVNFSSWTTADLPADLTGRQNMVAVGNQLGVAYIGLGDNSNIWYGYIASNPNPWVRLADCPVKTGGGAAFFTHNRTYVVQGTNPNGYADTSGLYMFTSIADNTWSFNSRVPATFPNKNALSFELDGIAYVFGGERCTTSGCVVSNNLHSFNNQNRTFTTHKLTPGGNRNNSSTFVINGKAYLNSRGSTYGYNQSMDRWGLITHPDSKMRAETIASYVLNGRVIGFDAAGRVYEYRPL